MSLFHPDAIVSGCLDFLRCEKKIAEKLRMFYLDFFAGSSYLASKKSQVVTIGKIFLNYLVKVLCLAGHQIN